MKAHVAQLAGGARNADRVFLTDHAAIVLDGASAFLPVDIDPATYAATLGEAIADQLDRQPSTPLFTVVSDGIARAAQQLRLTEGRSPSSTVSILRARDERVELYALGDSPIHYGTDHTATCLTDDRLARVAVEERRRYVERLRAGHGYDDEHRAALVVLQTAQRAARNTPDGHWIAEANPTAAQHGITRTVPAAAITWAVLATDGAADLIDHLGPTWPDVAHTDADELAELLERLHEWEAITDPDGRHLPRSKRHDDKTIVAVPAVW